MPSVRVIVGLALGIVARGSGEQEYPTMQAHDTTIGAFETAKLRLDPRWPISQDVEVRYDEMLVREVGVDVLDVS